MHWLPRAQQPSGRGYHHVGSYADAGVDESMDEESEVAEVELTQEQREEKADRQRVFLKRCSIGTVTASLGVFTFQGYAYNVVFLGRMLPAVGKQSLVLPCGLLFNLLWALALWSYFRAHLSDPGRVPREWYEFVDRTGEDLLVDAPRMEWQPGRASLCSKCMAPRPERAHHCFVCDVCVLRMDHHCPWISNCVGFGNHKFFLLLGGYACLACLAVVSTSLPELLQCAALVAGWEDSDLEFADACALIWASCIAGAACACLSALMYVHAPLATQNATTIEDNYDNMPNPFDQGDSLRNCAQVFGEFGADWFLPVRPRRPLSDGVSFTRFGEVFQRVGGAGAPGGLPPGPPLDQAEADRLWPPRYGVRQAHQQGGDGAQDGAGPVSMLARFLLGSGADKGQQAPVVFPTWGVCSRPPKGGVTV